MKKFSDFLRKSLKFPFKTYWLSFFKKDPFFLFIILFLFMFCDQVMKRLCLIFRIKTDYFLGFAFDLTPNENFILSLELTTDHFFKTIILTPVFIWLVFFYFLSVHYIPKNMKFIRWGWTLAAAGAFSNMVDKLRTGHVLDIFAFHLKGVLHIYFNFADLILTIGFILLIYGIVKHRRRFKKIPEKRKTFVVLKKEQWHFIFSIIWIAFCFGLLFFILNSQFLAQYAKISEGLREQFLLFAFKYFTVVIILFLLPVIMAFIYLSNKIYGPVYAFERYIRALLKKENPEDLRLREGDHLRRLEVLAKEVKESLKPK